MPRDSFLLILLASSLCAMGACSQTSGAASPSANGTADSVASSTPADATQGSDAKPLVLDCGKVFAPADVAGIFTAPIKVGPDPVRGGCTFEITHAGDPYGGDLNVNLGRSDDTDFSMPWNDVTESTDRANFTALPGTGDQAFWSTRNGNELLSKKGSLYCRAVLFGYEQARVNHIAEQSPEQRGKALGALCNKAFADH
jgi:hypothetical protein